jgi:UDP-N-acetyl-D-mannosaminuronic acid transferase (WecB/TagA/CpsF family)
MLHLALASSKAGKPIYLFGPHPGILADIGVSLVLHTGGRLDIAGSSSPEPGFDPDSADADAAIDRIVASGARMCLAAFDACVVAILTDRAAARGTPVEFVSVGTAVSLASHR